MGIQITRKESLRLLLDIEELPTIPTLLQKIMAASEDENINIIKLTIIIKQDQAICAMILKVANSVYFNRSSESVIDIKKAITLIGIAEAINIAMSISLLHGVFMDASEAIIGRFWVHAFVTATVAKHIARLHDPDQKFGNHSLIFTAGLFHEIGRVAIASVIDICYFNDDALCNLDGRQLIEEEYKKYGLSHPDAGALLLKAWGMPRDLYTSVYMCDYGLRTNKSWAAHICCLADKFVLDKMSHITSFENVSSEVRDVLEKHKNHLIDFPIINNSCDCGHANLQLVH